MSLEVSSYLAFAVGMCVGLALAVWPLLQSHDISRPNLWLNVTGKSLFIWHQPGHNYSESYFGIGGVRSSNPSKRINKSVVIKPWIVQKGTKKPSERTRFKVSHHSALSNSSSVNQSKDTNDLTGGKLAQTYQPYDFFNQTMYADCIQDNIGIKGWNSVGSRKSSVLRLSRVHLHFESHSHTLFISVPQAYVQGVKAVIDTCNYNDGIFPNHRRPKVVVIHGDAAHVCESKDEYHSSILTQTQFWGSFYHSVVDFILPWFFTVRALGMDETKPVQIQLYSTDVWEDQRRKRHAAINKLNSMANCLGLQVHSSVGVQAGCYSTASLGFLFLHRPAVWPNVKASELVSVSNLRPLMEAAHRQLQGCHDLLTHSVAPRAQRPRWLLVQRTVGPDDRKIKLFGESADSISVVKDTDRIEWNLVGGLIAVEGATFANQIFMPLGSTLVEINVPRKEYVGPTCWHSALAQYLGNKFVSVEVKAHSVNLSQLALVLHAAEQVPGRQYCFSKEMKLPLQCRRWPDEQV